ncbi:hypothetical protein AHAS_Ahas04G0150300 [Arachis hypogaea]
MEVNTSWVREFYANYYTGALDEIFLRGKQILVSEEDLEEILHFPPKTSGNDDYEKEKGEQKMLTFDWYKVMEVIAKPGSSWTYGANKTVPKGISINALTIEPRIWQQILSNYVMSSTHETELIADMAVLICKKNIPHGNWYKSQPSTRRRGRSQAASTFEAGTSAAVAEPPPVPHPVAPPSPSSQPIHHLV